MVIQQYKTRQILITIWALNSITTHRLLTSCYGVPSNTYRHQTTNDFEKLLDLENNKNTSIIITPIFLVFYIYIGLTTFLEDSAPNTEFDIDKRFCPESIGLDCNDSAIVEAIAVIEDDKDEERDL